MCAFRNRKLEKLIAQKLFAFSFVLYATMKLFYRELGQGQPMIIMHGIFGSSDNWLTQARHFSAKYHVITLDLRNHGQSEHHPDFDYPVMANDLNEFIDSKGLKDAIVIG